MANQTQEPLITLSPAVRDDLPGIKALADQHKKEIGFVLAPAIQASIDEGGLWIAKALPSQQIVGFVCFHHRRDRITKIYEIVVAPLARGRGLGRQLIGAVQEQALRAGHYAIRLKTPEDLPANDFYRRLGFADQGLEQGKKRRLRHWFLELLS